jgi:hypothetical protein
VQITARKVSGPTTRSVKKLAAAAHWPGAKHTQHKMNPSGNYFDKYRRQGSMQTRRRLPRAGPGALRVLPGAMRSGVAASAHDGVQPRSPSRPDRSFLQRSAPLPYPARNAVPSDLPGLPAGLCCSQPKPTNAALFVPNENANLAGIPPSEHPLYRWGARTAYSSIKY